MNWFYRNLVRPSLFKNDAESIHEFTLKNLEWFSRNGFACDVIESFLKPADLPVIAFGLRFPNPVGLAAGMDKNAVALCAWDALGFGFSELGGVTRHAQPGNPRPRVFRAVREEAIVNRMGFNNEGAAALAGALQHWRHIGRWPCHPVGINLGKSKITPLEDAAGDYADSFRLLRNLADFFVVNVSSPNTPNLRQLQDKAALDEIFCALNEVNSGSPEMKPRAQTVKPILVKVAPDLAFEAVDDILDLATRRGIAGIVATNTTITRPDASDESVGRVYAETGGLSGRPLRARSTEIVRHLYRQSRGRLPIIGVGGIASAEDAWEKITAGATLVQIYTGLVYEGPGLAKSIVTGLRSKMAEAGLTRIIDAVGIASRA